MERIGMKQISVFISLKQESFFPKPAWICIQTCGKFYIFLKMLQREAAPAKYNKKTG